MASSTTARRKRGDASLGINAREAFWKDLVRVAMGKPDGDEDGVKPSGQDVRAAQRIVADRIFPKVKPVSQRMTLQVPKGATTEELINLLLTSAMTGKCDPETATNLIQSINAAYQVTVNKAMVERFAVMEEEFEEFMRWKLAQTGNNGVEHNL